MANAIFSGSLPIEETSIVPNRRNSRAGSLSFARRTSRAGSGSQSVALAAVHLPFINEALAEARASLSEGGIPIGSVLVRHGQIIARGYDRRVQRRCFLSHAEMDCLEAAGKQSVAFYGECTLYTTLSPCAISAGAIRYLGIPRVVIGDNKIFHGDEALLRASNLQVDVLESHESREIMETYVKANPAVWDEYNLHRWTCYLQLIPDPMKIETNKSERFLIDARLSFEYRCTQLV